MGQKMKYMIKKLKDIKAGEWFQFGDMWYELGVITPAHRGSGLKDLMEVKARPANTPPNLPLNKYRTLHLPPEIKLNTYDYLPFF